MDLNKIAKALEVPVESLTKQNKELLDKYIADKESKKVK